MKLKVDASHSRSIQPGSIKISASSLVNEGRAAEKQLRFHRHCIHWPVQCRQWKTKRLTTLQCNAVTLIWVFHVMKTETQSLLWFNARPRSRCSSRPPSWWICLLWQWQQSSTQHVDGAVGCQYKLHKTGDTPTRQHILWYLRLETTRQTNSN